MGWWKLDDNTGTTATDSSSSFNGGTTNNGSLENTPTWALAHNGYGLTFNGSNQYISLTNNAIYRPANALTVAAWIKGSVTQNSEYAQIVANGSDAITGYNLYLYSPSGQQITFIVNDVSWGDCYALSGISGNDNAWHHAVGTYSGTELKVYVDGVLKTTDACGNTGIGYGGAPVLTIGRKPTGNYFTGTIDDVRIYNRALTAAEVKDLYNQGSLIAWWKLDENTGTSTADSSCYGGTSSVDRQCNVNTGTLQNTPSWVAGRSGSALSFVGASSQTVDFGTAINPGSQATFSLWIKTTSNDNLERVFSKETSDYDTPFVFYKSAASTYKFFTSKSAGGNAYADVIFATTGINDGNWHHLVATVSTTTVTTYLDGVLKNTAAWTHGIKSSSQSVLIGYSSHASATYFDGTVDDIRVYDRALTAAEVRDLYMTDNANKFGAD